MALIRPGIWENLKISPKTKVNEHGTLELVIGASQSEDAELQAFQNNVVSISMESNFRFYPPNLTTFDKTVKSSGDIGEELRRIRQQFINYGKLYATAEQVEKYVGGMSMFEGIGIPPADYGKALKMLTNDEFLKKIVTNLANRFVKFLEDSGAYTSNVSFRQKFLRQSKDKNYAVIPTSDFDVWLEPMTISKEMSQIAFSKWEIDNGKNDPNPAASSASANTTKADVNTGKNLFAGPADATQPAAIAPAAVAPPVAQPVAPPVVPTAAPAFNGGQGAPLAPPAIPVAAPVAPVAEHPVTPAAAFPTQGVPTPASPDMAGGLFKS